MAGLGPPAPFRPPFGAGARPPSNLGATVPWLAVGRGSFVPGLMDREAMRSRIDTKPDVDPV